MEKILYIGQWQGYFQYGAEYGEFLKGKEAEFRLFIETLNGESFSGRAIDWEGIGAEGETARVEGSIDGNQIHFTKQYPHLLTLDPWGVTEAHTNLPGYCVVYEGCYDPQARAFSGTWQISVKLGQVDELEIEELSNGTWRMAVLD